MSHYIITFVLSLRIFVNLLVSSLPEHVWSPLSKFPVFIIVRTIVIIRGLCVTLPLSHYVPANWIRL